MGGTPVHTGDGWAAGHGGSAPTHHGGRLDETAGLPSFPGREKLRIFGDEKTNQALGKSVTQVVPDRSHLPKVYASPINGTVAKDCVSGTTTPHVGLKPRQVGHVWQGYDSTVQRPRTRRLWTCRHDQPTDRLASQR